MLHQVMVSRGPLCNVGFVLSRRRQDEQERQVRLALKKKNLQEQDEYESIGVDDGQAGPYGAPAR